MSTEEIRAGDLNKGQRFREDGMDDIHTVDSIKFRGDTALIECEAGCEITSDRDEVVEGMDFAPVNIAGQITLANGRSVHFQITDVAGTIGYSQWGETNEVLWHTVSLLEGLVKTINEDDLLVVPHGR